MTTLGPTGKLGTLSQIGSQRLNQSIDEEYKRVMFPAGAGLTRIVQRELEEMLDADRLADVPWEPLHRPVISVVERLILAVKRDDGKSIVALMDKLGPIENQVLDGLSWTNIPKLPAQDILFIRLASTAAEAGNLQLTRRLAMRIAPDDFLKLLEPAVKGDSPDIVRTVMANYPGPLDTESHYSAIRQAVRRNSRSTLMELFGTVYRFPADALLYAAFKGNRDMVREITMSTTGLHAVIGAAAMDAIAGGHDELADEISPVNEEGEEYRYIKAAAQGDPEGILHEFIGGSFLRVMLSAVLNNHMDLALQLMNAEANHPDVGEDTTLSMTINELTKYDFAPAALELAKRFKQVRGIAADVHPEEYIPIALAAIENDDEQLLDDLLKDVTPSGASRLFVRLAGKIAQTTNHRMMDLLLERTSPVPLLEMQDFPPTLELVQLLLDVQYPDPAKKARVVDLLMFSHARNYLYIETMAWLLEQLERA